MKATDPINLARTAQKLVVEVRRGRGSPPHYSPLWEPLWNAKVDRIEINRGSKPSRAVIWFPDVRWDSSPNLLWGDIIRIRTNQWYPSRRTIVFVGFLTSYNSDFSGGDEHGGCFERNSILCLDYRWLLAVTSPIVGQFARGPDDYTNYGTPAQAPIDGQYTWLSGKRVIFNPDGKPNSDSVFLKVLNSKGGTLCQTPIFADPDVAIPWTARDMVLYILSPLNNQVYDYWPISDPNDLIGLDHPDFDKVINHIVVDGLNVMDALQLVCKHVGWDFRIEFFNNGTIDLVFYNVAAASGYTRTNSNPTILHWLHAPAADENITSAVSAAAKMLWSMSLAEDIAAVVNNPWGLGAPQRFEFTAELVPAWLDSNLVPDTSDDNANLFKTEAELQDITDPNSLTYYLYYHPRGAGFLRDVSRKWSLNEAGRYSLVPYDRGMPFDFAGVVPAQYIFDAFGKRVFAPFNRQLLPCLTLDEAALNSVGIRVEFSFDGGVTWQVIPSAIVSLSDECAIYIAETNLAELVDQAEGTISGGDLDGVQLNFWTSLCDDKLNTRIFKNGEWKTRVRVTASVQLDQRLARQDLPTSSSGSPFYHARAYDFSDKYALAQRTAASFYDYGLPVAEMDSTLSFDRHLTAIRAANEDMSISGRFTLERLWLGDGSGIPAFCIGDCIEKITGRQYMLSASVGGGEVYPEIVQIIYLPASQRMTLITRDLRFAEVLL